MSIKLIDKIEIVKDVATPNILAYKSSISVPASGVSDVLLPQTIAQTTLVGETTTQTLTNKTYKIGTASKAVVTNATGDIEASTVTSTEVGYLAGVTSAIQTQLNTLNAFELFEIRNTSSLVSKNYPSTTITNSVVIGVDAYSGYNDTTLIGHNAIAYGSNGVNIGAETISNDGIAIGYGAKSANGSGTEYSNTAIGAGARAYKATVIDPDVTESIAIGNGTWAKGTKSIVIGDYSSSITQGDIVIGYNASVAGASSTTNQTSIAIGRDAIAAQGTIAIGSAAHPIIYTPDISKVPGAVGYIVVYINGSYRKLYLY